MKRTSNGDAADPHHPALSFHREVLIIQQWTKIRRDFLKALELEAAKSSVVQWHEPRKLWRHAQEALGKWILSQVARVHLAGLAVQNNARDDDTEKQTSESTTPLQADLHEADIFFFPTAEQLQRAAAVTAAASPRGTSSSSASPSVALPNVSGGTTTTLKTYDEQLVRDLSLKSNGTHDAAGVAAIVALVKNFQLPQRCVAAAAAVEAGMRGVTPQTALQPRIRRLEANDSQRTPQQQRIAGPLAEVSVQWPRHWRREQCRDCAAVSLPWAALEKLQMCYRYFSDEAEHQRYDKMPSHDSAAARQRRFELRAATVILRYEGGLATGSLQLCADTRLKQHLHAAGYHVMDLCASPINAYMGVPQEGAFAAADTAPATAVPSSSATEVPNHFCSAFYDVDRYFGSMGSAVAVDPLRIYRVPEINSEGKPLLLTLDVPYDEDLCELLFQKLVQDMRRASEAPGQTSAASAAVVDYVLVLPLWWDIQMKIQKRWFAETTHDKAMEHVPAADVSAFIRERAAMLQEGYRVPYTWPTALAEAAGDRLHQSSAPAAWVCFDGVFIDDRYGYFCTATNKWLHGVTTTEVIGLAQPRLAPAEPTGGADAAGAPSQLQQALDRFYNAADATA